MFSQLRIFRYISIVSLTFILAYSTGFAAQQSRLPKRIVANYVVSKDGTPFAKVSEIYLVTGNTYKVESTTKGIGIYALLGQRKLTSTGLVTAQGLKPQHFELHQGHSESKTLLSDFDWSNNTLTMLVKGTPQVVPLAAGTQDLASFAYQFMFISKSLKNDITVTLTTGKKLNQYQYKIQPELEVMNVDGTQYKTMHLVPAIQSSEHTETKELWLLRDKNFILGRFLMVDEDGAKLEQTLTEFHFD